MAIRSTGRKDCARLVRAYAEFRFHEAAAWARSERRHVSDQTEGHSALKESPALGGAREVVGVLNQAVRSSSGVSASCDVDSLDDWFFQCRERMRCRVTSVAGR